ncbi:MAG: sugar phosphorylase [bacterium]|nr:sugar phosphorylase [bacterium]
MSDAIKTRIQAKLSLLYGAEQVETLFPQVMQLIDSFPVQRTPSPEGTPDLNLTEKDAILITYGDMVHSGGEAPLKTLHDFLKATIHEQVNTVHLLPFYPYSSDDGFSVIDYYAVNPEVGTWDDVRTMRQDFNLMFDLVLNHISAESGWFRAYLRGEAPYDGYFIDFAPDEIPHEQLKLVRRPRALPLITPFQTSRGERHVWTTFSADQIDLNVENPAVLLELLKIMLFYVENGANLLRLDAITYLWKTLGTESVHLPQTHTVAQLMRDVLDYAAPHVVIITETNVPHLENISYFGSGSNEAQMVYNFSLPPLLLHTYRTGDATILTNWAATLERVGERTTFFNFTASHDGIGVTPARGILPDADIDALVQLAEAHGGFVSYKNNSDGTRSPYELNATYFDAITHPDITARDPETAIARFLGAQSIMLAMMGVPGIYFHSLFGSRNWREGVEQTGRYRTINRQKFEVDVLRKELSQAEGLRRHVLARYLALLRVRGAQLAFHPLAAQTVLNLHPGVVAIQRGEGRNCVLALTNVREDAAEVTLPDGRWRDLLGGELVLSGKVTLMPYQVAWLKRL